MYSNGQSEIVLGKAIKQLNLPRDEIVVMTKVNTNILHLFFPQFSSTGFLYCWKDSQHPLLGRWWAREAGLRQSAWAKPQGSSQQLGFRAPAYCLTYQHIFESIKHSLERLQLDYVDVLQCVFRIFLLLSIELTGFSGHRFDTDTPIAETVDGI